MNDRETILGLIERYKTAIHTGAAEDFFPIWAEEHPTTLISIGRKFSGTENIYHEFVAGLIQNAYSRIDLITRDAEIQFIDENTAVAIFSYYTDCIRRETGEPHSIRGIETQIYVREKGEWKLMYVHYAAER